MSRLEAHGLAAAPPRGWDATIYRRPAEDPVEVTTADGRRVAAAEAPTPIMHLANFALPPDRGDYGSGAVEVMGSGGIFISLLEHDTAEVTEQLFAGRPRPWPLAPGDFDPQQMQRTIAGQAGCQRFFAEAGRPFCLYVVLGSYAMRGVLVPEVNAALATIEIA